MNKQPVDYKQYDTKWSNIPYNGKGENDKTIKSSGCGPTCAAMVIATLVNSKITPVDTCTWSVKNGYKYANQGTAYSYFVPQLAQYGINCKQLLNSRIVNKPNHAIHDQVKQYLKDGYYIIALMGTKANGSRGTWTSSGHYVLVWDWDDKVRINDPIHKSGDNKYSNGDPNAFKDEVRMYWLVDARQYNQEEEEMTKEQYKELFKEAMAEYIAELAEQPCSYAEEQAAMSWAQQKGLIRGNDKGNTMPKKFLTRGEMAIMLQRYDK